MTIQIDPAVAVLLILLASGLRSKDIRRIARRGRRLTELIAIFGS
jgi:hypothetical protein